MLLAFAVPFLSAMDAHAGVVCLSARLRVTTGQRWFRGRADNEQREKEQNSRHGIADRHPILGSWGEGREFISRDTHGCRRPDRLREYPNNIMDTLTASMESPMASCTAHCMI